jgi:hypothetical protein
MRRDWIFVFLGLALGGVGAALIVLADLDKCPSEPDPFYPCDGVAFGLEGPDVAMLGLSAFLALASLACFTVGIRRRSGR